MKKILLIFVLILIELVQPSYAFGHAMGFASVDATIEGKTLTAKFKYPEKIFSVGSQEVFEFFNANFQVSNNNLRCPMKVEAFTPPTDSAQFTFTCEKNIEKLKVRSLLSQNLGYTYPSTFRKDGHVKNFTFDMEKSDFEAEFSASSWLKDITGKVYDFIKLGMFHIYTGYDHVAFLLAVILVLSGFRKIIKAVTAFTLAHSTTLILSAFGAISLTSKIVEPIIALSIAYVAFENIFFSPERSRTGQRRWLIAFIFGLVHGLGFAGALSEINIPRNELLIDLVSFNIGIELGQLSIIAVVLPLLYWLNRFSWKNKLITLLSILIGGAGLFWFLERIGLLSGLQNLFTLSKVPIYIWVILAFVLGLLTSILILKPKYLLKFKAWVRSLFILVITISLTLGFIPGIFNLKPQKAYAAIPSGVIVMWPSTNASIPSGWTRVTGLDGRFPKMIATSGTNPGATGGASTHTHTQGTHSHAFAAHTHTGGNTDYPSPTTAVSGLLGTDKNPSDGGHQHATSYTSASDPTSGSSTPPTTSTGTSEPPYFEVIFIKSDGTPTGIPNSAIVWWNSATPPTGWRATDGAGGAPDLRNRFMKGAATGGDGGTTGGTSDVHTHAEGGTHSHTSGGTHTHSVTYATNADEFSQTGTSVTVSTDSHAHASSTSGATDSGALAATTPGASSASDAQPPWYKVYAIQNNSGANSFPVNIIVMWDGTLASIPSGWFLSDGLSGRPNLSNSSFVKALNTTGELGTTGGATTHTHSGASHTHSGTSHTHTVGSSGAASGSVSAYNSGGISTGPDPAHTHAAGSSTPSGATTNANNAASSAVNANSSNSPVYTEVAYITFSNSNPNAPTIMGSSPIPGSKPNKNATTITLQGTATDPDASDTVQIDWDYSSNSGGAWTNIGTTSLGTQGATLSKTWTVSGLTAASTYRLRARTLDNGGAASSYTTQSADWTLTSGCSPPVSGDLTIASSCAFPETVDGVDAGNITINTSITLTINASQTVAFNSLKSITVNGSTAVNATGQIKQTNLWMVDSDADGWPSTAVQSAQDSTPGGTYRRRNLLNSDRIIDCNDAASSSTNSC